MTETARQPLAMITTKYGDFDGRRECPAGWTHLPADPLSVREYALRDAAKYLEVPAAPYLAKLEHGGGTTGKRPTTGLSSPPTERWKSPVSLA